MTENIISKSYDIKLSKGAKFEITDKNITIFNVPLTGEQVQEYDDGFAYKPLDEVKTIEVQNVPVTFLHPDKSVDEMSTPEAAENQSGFLRKPSFDEKFQDKLYSDIVLFRNEDTKILEEKLKKGEGIDVSIGFKFIKENKSGKFLGKVYDYIQRSIKLDHLAILLDRFGQVHPGRAPFPNFGIGADNKNNNKKMVEEKYTQLSNDHALLQKDFDGLKTENESLKKQVTDGEEEKKTLKTEIDSKTSELKTVKDELQVFKDEQKAEIDSMREDLIKKMPAMEQVFKTADAESIKKTHEEIKKNAPSEIQGKDGEETEKGSDCDTSTMFRSVKSEEE